MRNWQGVHVVYTLVHEAASTSRHVRLSVPIEHAPGDDALPEAITEQLDLVQGAMSAMQHVLATYAVLVATCGA